MPRSSHQELRWDRGILAGRHRPVWRHWREPYVFALAIPWPAFLVLIASLFLAINLLFAALYRLDPAGIGGGAGPRASFAEVLAGGASAFRLLLRRHPGRPTQRRRQWSAAPHQLGGLRPDPPLPAALRSWAAAGA